MMTITGCFKKIQEYVVFKFYTYFLVNQQIKHVKQTNLLAILTNIFSFVLLHVQHKLVKTVM